MQQLSFLPGEMTPGERSLILRAAVDPFGYYRKTDRLLCLLTLLLVLILVTVSGVSVFVLLQ